MIQIQKGRVEADVVVWIAETCLDRKREFDENSTAEAMVQMNGHSQYHASTLQAKIARADD